MNLNYKTKSESDLRKLCKAMEDVINKQADFINVLQDDLDDAAEYAAANDWHSMFIKEGKRAHKALAAAEDRLDALINGHLPKGVK